MRNEQIYLFYDKREQECLEAEQYLSDSHLPFTKVPSRGMHEAQLVIGQNTFRGIDRIKSAIEKILKKAA